MDEGDTKLEGETMPFPTTKSKLRTTALVSALALVPLGAGVAAVALPAHAQQSQDAKAPPPPPPPGPRHGPEADHGKGDMARDGRGDDHHGWGKGRFADHHGHRGNRAMHLAERLAGVETAIGIRSDQLDAWRHFTSLLVSFASPPQWPDPAMAGPGDDMDGGDAMAPDDAPGEADTADAPTPPPPPAGDTAGQQGNDTSSFGPLNFMVDRAIERGEKAKELKDAMAKLDTVLTPEQKAQARMLMRPEHGMRHHWNRDRHDRGGRHDRHGPGGRM